MARMCFRQKAVIPSPAEYLYGDIEDSELRWSACFLDGPRDARRRQAPPLRSCDRSCCTGTECAQS